MIKLLKGEVVDDIIVLNQNIGYEISHPYEHLSGENTLYIYTHVKEDILKLYAFKTLEERDFFTSLIKINRVGPLLALNLMRKHPLNYIINAINKGEKSSLKGVKGLSEKLISQIFENIKLPENLLNIENNIHSDSYNFVYDILVNLGYNPNVISPVLKRKLSEIQSEEFNEDNFEEILLKKTIEEVAR